MHSRFLLALAGFQALFGLAVSEKLEEYEYVVVGSGPGGGPLAARLALAGHSVLLIDAGDDQGESMQQAVPAFNLASTEFDQMRWDYFVRHYDDDTRQQQDTKVSYQTPDGKIHTGPNPQQGSTIKGVLYPRAGTLGGCSTHNALITVYPHESDWSHIASLTGDDSWNPKNMRKYFQLLEKNLYVPNSAGHGKNGWLSVSLTDRKLALSDSKIVSLVSGAARVMGLGIKNVANLLKRDMNSADAGRDSREGLFMVPMAVSKEGRRSSARDIILEVANAKNPDGSKKYKLDIRLNCLVTKVRFDNAGDGKKPRAVGVDFLDGRSLYRADPRSSADSEGGEPGEVNASKEVILAAGAFNTPQLLKLSGVGPKDELAKFGIPLVAELPGVGTNLQDRYEVAVINEADSDFTTFAGCTFGNEGDPCLQRWRDNVGGNQGIYASNGIAVGLVKKTKAASDSEPPDIVIAGGPLPFKGYYPNYATEAFRSANSWAWVILKAHTRNNAGTITLRTKDPRDVPQINFRYFAEGVTEGGADDLDSQALVETVELAREMFRKSIGVKFQETWPGPEVNSKESVDKWVRDEAWGHHASCTCPIGPDNDPNAVLDSKFRVRGVDGLRVVDASVFPKIPGFYIAVPVYMISEKAAEVILADAGGK